MYEKFRNEELIVAQLMIYSTIIGMDDLGVYTKTSLYWYGTETGS